jgi:hypothetical protein
MAEETPEERKARWRSITIGGRAPGQGAATNSKPRPVEQPVWEGTKVTEKRPGGFEIPFVHADKPSNPVTAKQMQNKRGHYEAQIKRLKNDPSVFRDERKH